MRHGRTAFAAPSFIPWFPEVAGWSQQWMHTVGYAWLRKQHGPRFVVLPKAPDEKWQVISAAAGGADVVWGKSFRSVGDAGAVLALFLSTDQLAAVGMTAKAETLICVAPWGDDSRSQASWPHAFHASSLVDGVEYVVPAGILLDSVVREALTELHIDQGEGFRTYCRFESPRLVAHLLLLQANGYSFSPDYLWGLLGNFPQAFSHIGLINTAYTIAEPANRTAHV